jgi:hypothetical protein
MNADSRSEAECEYQALSAGRSSITWKRRLERENAAIRGLEERGPLVVVVTFNGSPEPIESQH